MKQLTNFEVQTVSGGSDPLAVLVVAGIMIACVAVVAACSSKKEPIDFSTMTPEQAYLKGYEEGQNAGFIFGYCIR
jgi:hypothetical protein